MVGATSVCAAGAPKAYVGLFKEDAVAVIHTAQNKMSGTISKSRKPLGRNSVVGRRSDWSELELLGCPDSSCADSLVSPDRGSPDGARSPASHPVPGFARDRL